MTRARRRPPTLVLLAALTIAGLAGTASATEVGSSRTFGLGVQFGDPTAFTGKVFIGAGNAIDFGLGFWGWGYNRCRGPDERWRNNCQGGLSVHADYLWQSNLVRQNARLDWYIGAGGRILFYNTFGDSRDDVQLVARMPVGLALTFDRPSFLEVFFEIAPGLILLPPLYPDLDAAVGVRFYF